MAIEQLKLENQVSFRLYTASRLVAQLYEPLLKRHGITYTQYLVLLVLWERNGMPVNDIAKKLYLGINTISPLVKRLAAMSLVEVRNCAEDRRKQLVFLTPQGIQMESASTNMKAVYRKQKVDRTAQHERKIEALKREIERTKNSLKNAK